MSNPKFIEIDGKRLLRRDVLQRRREQSQGLGESGAACLVRVARGPATAGRPHGGRAIPGTFALFTLLDEKG